MPRADMLLAFTTEISEVPSTSNPLGLRGGGEGGTTPAPAAVVNAIVDALAHLGVEHVEMPATPERVWEAIRTAAEGKGFLEHLAHANNDANRERMRLALKLATGAGKTMVARAGRAPLAFSA